MKTFKAEHVRNLNNVMRVIASAKTKAKLIEEIGEAMLDCTMLQNAAEDTNTPVAKAAEALWYALNEHFTEIREISLTFAKLRVLGAIGNAEVWLS